jgi:hypothetical protein
VWGYVVPFGPIRVTFSGKCFPVQPLKVNESTSIEIWNLLHIFVGVTLEFYWVSYCFLLKLGSKCNSYCHYIEKEKNLDMCVCVCVFVCVCACAHMRVQNVPLDLSANCCESYDYKLCLTKTITNNIVNLQRCI